MSLLLVAIHGILTRQTDASWPDRFDAWLSRRDPSLRVIKQEYAAGPFPRWNCLVTNPRLARSLASELRLFFDPVAGPGAPELWFVAHSNGAVIALLTARQLIAGGLRVGGLVLTGAACEADVTRNAVLAWRGTGQLGAAIAYSSEDDAVVAGDPRAPRHWLRKIRDWAWGKLMWPYGCLGRTGWTWDAPGRHRWPARGRVCPGVFTRWFPGGHTAYFAPDRIEQTFEQIYFDVTAYGRRRPEDAAAPGNPTNHGKIPARNQEAL